MNWVNWWNYIFIQNLNYGWMTLKCNIDWMEVRFDNSSNSRRASRRNEKSAQWPGLHMSLQNHNCKIRFMCNFGGCKWSILSTQQNPIFCARAFESLVLLLISPVLSSTQINLHWTVNIGSANAIWHFVAFLRQIVCKPHQILFIRNLWSVIWVCTCGTTRTHTWKRMKWMKII